MFTNTSTTAFTIVLITIFVIGLQVVANSVGIDLSAHVAAAMGR